MKTWTVKSEGDEHQVEAHTLEVGQTLSYLVFRNKVDEIIAAFSKWEHVVPVTESQPQI